MDVKDNLAKFFARDLLKLKEEIGLYKDEANLWVTSPGINNSAGNLCLHLIGNLKHFIGATLGHTGYVRERDLEFSTKDVPREHLLKQIDETLAVVTNTLDQMTEQDLFKTFPLEKHGEVVSNSHMLLHLFGHLNYHLGQVNYHRRLVEG